MLQSVYTVLAMEETTKSLRMSFHLYTATTTHKIDFNLNILMHGHRQCKEVHRSDDVISYWEFEMKEDKMYTELHSTWQ